MLAVMSSAGPDDPLARSARRWLPLSCEAARRAGLGELLHAAATASTNDDLAAGARRGERWPAVLVADHQTAGRGRLGRRWSDAAAGSHRGEASLLVSFRLTVPTSGSAEAERPVGAANKGGTDPAEAELARPWPERPVSEANKSGTEAETLRARPCPRPPEDCVAAVAAAALAAVAQALPAGGAAVRSKWPNDLLIESDAVSGKLAGVLSELVDGDPPVVVVGLGLNLAEAPAEPGAVALAQVAGAATRDELLGWIIDELPGGLADPRKARADLRAGSATLGRTVRVQRTDGTAVVGTAIDIDAAGRLIVAGDGGEVLIDTGDVFHLR